MRFCMDCGHPSVDHEWDGIIVNQSFRPWGDPFDFVHSEGLDNDGNWHNDDADRLAAAARGELVAEKRAELWQQLHAVVYDQPILQYRNGELDDGGLRLLPGTFENQTYAFAVGDGSTLREPVGREILRITNGSDWPELKRKYLGATPQ